MSGVSCGSDRVYVVKAVMTKCKDCGHLKQFNLADEKVCDIGREPDRFNCCPEFYNGYINRIVTAK